MLQQDRPATNGAARPNTDAGIESLASRMRSSEDSGTETRATEADAVVIQCCEGPDEGRGASGGFHCIDQALPGWVADYEGNVERHVGRETEDGGLHEANQGVQFTALTAAAHVHHFAGEGNTLDGVGVVERPAVVFAHVF